MDYQTKQKLEAAAIRVREADVIDREDVLIIEARECYQLVADGAVEEQLMRDYLFYACTDYGGGGLFLPPFRQAYQVSQVLTMGTSAAKLKISREGKQNEWHMD